MSRVFWVSMIVASICLSGLVPVLSQTTSQELFDAGVAARDQGDINAAIDHFEKCIETDQDFSPAYNELGLLYLSNGGNTDDVVWLFEQAAKINPQEPEYYSNMCRAYFQNEQFDWAESACLQALRVNPQYGSAQLSLAWLYLMGMGRPADAIPYFKQVIERMPKPKIYLGLGMAYARNNDMANTLDVITKLREMGEEALATQLEKLIRPKGEAPPVFEPFQHRSAPESKIVTSREEPAPAPAAAPQSPVPFGKIQIRGRLVPPQIKSADGTLAGSPEATNDYEGLSIAERMERVRRMRGATRSGSTQGTVNIQGGTGTGTAQLIPPAQ